MRQGYKQIGTGTNSMDERDVKNTCVTAYELQQFATMGLPAQGKKHRIGYRKSQAQNLNINDVLSSIHH